jgi:predicted acetylornithine/succinylornithine family transaminase
VRKVLLENLIKEEEKFILPTYRRLPVAFTRGEGVYLWDKARRRYLDFIAGIGVNNLGYNHPAFRRGVENALSLPVHTSNLYYIEPQIELAKLLSQVVFEGKVFFCNSGAEAIEAALKLARRVSYRKEKYEVITLERSFHGRTFGALSATAQKKIHEGFEPLLPGFKYVEFNNPKAVERAISRWTAAVLLEPVQGEGGVRSLSQEYLQAVREICDTHDILLIFDEVQCGLGRLGEMAAWQVFGVKPDIIVLAKALGGGLPIGAIIARESIAPFLKQGSHASTFGGGPFITTVAQEIVKAIKEELSNVRKMGEVLKKELEVLVKKYPFIKEARGQGLMLGLELKIKGEKIVRECLERGVLINCVKGNTLRFLPPLIIKKRHIKTLIRVLNEVFSKEL